MKYFCKKCGQWDVKIDYMPPLPLTGLDRNMDDHLRCQCHKCGYIWIEDCADKKEQVSKSPSI